MLERSIVGYYRLEMKVGGKGEGGPHADYVLRLGRYKDQNGPEELEYSESGNMPKWATKPSVYWRAADRCERKNGMVYRETIMAIHRGLSKKQRIELVQNFRTYIVRDNRAYSLGIHVKASEFDGKPQPHVHLMVSPRIQDGIERFPAQFFKRANNKNAERGGAVKADEWHKDYLNDVRKAWEVAQNQALEKASIPDRVDCRSYKKQAIVRDKEKHWGPIVVANLTAKEKAAIQEKRDLQSRLVLAQKKLAAEMPDLDAELRQLDRRTAEHARKTMEEEQLSTHKLPDYQVQEHDYDQEIDTDRDGDADVASM